MKTARICLVLLAGVSAVAGVLISVLLANEPGLPVNELSVALVVTTYTLVAVTLSLARPGQLVGRLTLLGATAWGVGEGLLALGVRGILDRPGSIPAAEWLAVLGTAGRGFGWLMLVLAVPLVFPDGRQPWPGRRWPAYVVGAAVTGFLAATLLAPTPLDTRLFDVDSPTGLPERLMVVADILALSSLAISALALGVAVAGLIHRWRTRDELQRQQLLWFSAAFALPLLLIPTIAAPFTEPWMFGVVTLPVPVAMGIALFQKRLYDVQLVVSRTATYLVLSAAVAGLYAVTVGGVGALLQERGAPWLGWVAAGVVAVSFAPLRNVLQQAVNKVTYGQWSQPADVLAATGRRLSDAADVRRLLGTLADELASGLGIAFVEISDAHGRQLAVRGPEPSDSDELPLTAYGAPVGALRWSRQRLRAADRTLLEDLAHQLGGVVHAAGLVEELRAAQERLVLAREEERRRLRRDLHDGLGPTLASLTLEVDTLRNKMAAGDGLDDEQLVHLRSGIQATVLDVRRIVEGLRPHALDELGLLESLRQLVARMTAGRSLTVDLAAPECLPALPAASEVAFYRVAQEALTNAVRHAQATDIRVDVTAVDGGVAMTVSDNGTGEVIARADGLGLTSMRERAEEIGGRIGIDAVPGTGTKVQLWLPATMVTT